MGWIDDRLWCHPKVVNVSDSAFRVFVNGIAYSTGFSTKGRLSGGQQRIIGSTDDTKRELIEARLWEEADGDEVVIHDWDEHNSKRDARREADRKRKRESRAAEKKTPPPPVSAGASAGQSAGAARVDGSEGSDGSEDQNEDLVPAEQTRVPAIAALVETSLKSGQVAAPEPSAEPQARPTRLHAAAAAVNVDPLLELLPADEIKPNTRGVLERKFSQLPPRFVGLAREELLAREQDPLAADIRSRVRYLNGIADRMIDERAAQREVA